VEKLMKKLLQKLDTLGLLLLVAAAIWYSVTNIWSVWDIGLAIAGGLCIVTGIVFNYQQILSSLGKRSTKYAGNYIISLILVIAVVSGLNFIGQKHTKRFDLTAGGHFTLAPQTVKVLQNLNQEIDIMAFPSGGDDKALRELLTEYRTVSSKIRFEFIDPDRQPEIARQHEIQSYGTVLILCGDRSDKIEDRGEAIQEEDLTNSIIKIQRTETPRICIVQGHGEKDPSDEGQRGYSEAKKAMESQGYAVESINLVQSGGVPDGAQVLILAGAENEPFPQELEYINQYLGKGGGLLLMVDPDPSPSFAAYLHDWGVQVDEDLVLDVSGVGQIFGMGPSIPLVTEYENHAITERFNAMTFFPLTRSVHPLDPAPEGTTVTTLFKSNSSSWGEKDLKSVNAEYDPSVDLAGPLSLAVAVTREIRPASEDTPAMNARMVVVGTSNFPRNDYFGAQGNSNLFLNMISWLAQDDDLISIRPKDREDRRIVLTQSEGMLLRWILLAILPGIVLVAGIAVVMNRRRR
jgi:ABC-type uncharacterized transport system involved in gliding motility auxiliary subunit